MENEGSYTIPNPYAEPLKEELCHFIKCVEDRLIPISDGSIGQRAEVVAQAAQDLARTGMVVSFI